MTFGQYLGLFMAFMSVMAFASWITVLREATTPWHWGQDKYHPTQYFVWGVVDLIMAFLLLAGVE